MSSFTRIIVLSAILFIGVHSHSYLSSLYVDGKLQSEGKYLRPIPAEHYDYPISALNNKNGINTDAMICGALPEGKQAAKEKCPVMPGAKMGVQWHYQKGSGSSDNFIIDPSHKGPCLVYLAKSNTGVGSVWFKIFEDGYNIATKQWCVDKLRANKGRFDFNIPTGIAPGDYLMRVELIGLHEGEQLGGAQPYVHCAEIKIGGQGTEVPPSNALVAFPGAYKADTPGILFNIYSGNKYLKIDGYPIPGPKIHVFGKGNSFVPVENTTTGVQTTGVQTTGVQTTGVKVDPKPSTTGEPTTKTPKCSKKADYTACANSTATQRCYQGTLGAALSCTEGYECKYSPSSVDTEGNNNAYCVPEGTVLRVNEENGTNQLTKPLWVSMLLVAIFYLL